MADLRPAGPVRIIPTLKKMEKQKRSPLVAFGGFGNGHLDFFWKASPMVRIGTGWKPMLLYAVGRRASRRSADRWFSHDLESSLDAQESNVP